MARKLGSEFFARCATGFEAVLAGELKALGIARVRPLKGGAAFYGALADAYRACLWSRVATRIQLVLSRIDALDADTLYQGVYDIAWEEQMREGATVAVQAHGQNAALRNSQFTALKVKDALCDRLRDRRGTRPDVDAKDPGFSLDVSLHERRATLYLNLSGASLHRRGYREPGVQTEAPLKETLAAGILLAAGWDELAQAGAIFADPMCGSGTLAIEAALIAARIAPGALRTHWGFEGWMLHDTALWEELRREAELPRGSAGKGRLRILAGDIDPHAIQIARANARRAGIADLIDFEVADAATLGTRLAHLGRGSMSAEGLLATNPPYGYRLQSSEELSQTYAALAEAVASLPTGWRVAAITPDPGLDTVLGQTAKQVIPCYNGPLETTLRLYEVTPSAINKLQVIALSGSTRTVSVAERASEQFAARLRKVARERAKWAKRAGISCYRIYDADLPDYALSVDLYEGAGPDAGRRFVRVVEYPAPSSIDQDRAVRRFSDARALVAAVLDVDPTDVHAFPARHELAKSAQGPRTLVQVQEANLMFTVNLAARQDTGLPLDHRPTRALIGSMASGARFLSLDAYAGVPALYAAAGGASRVTIVDPAKPFLDEARKTLEANGFGARAHFERVAIGTWLTQTARRKQAFDLIYLDLLAFAEGPDAGRPFDPQRDHAERIAQVAGILAPAGTIVVTSGLRTLKLNYEALEAQGLRVRDATQDTIPHDFARTPKIHRTWLLTSS